VIEELLARHRRSKDYSKAEEAYQRTSEVLVSGPLPPCLCRESMSSSRYETKSRNIPCF